MRRNRLKPRSSDSYGMGMSIGSDKPYSPQCPHPRVARMKDEEKVLPPDEADDVHVFILYKAQLKSMYQGYSSCPCAYRILEFFVLSSEIRNRRPLLHQGYRRT